MQLTPDIKLQQKLINWSQRLSVIIIVLSLLVLTGWMFSIELLKHPAPGFVAMNPLTAICFSVLSLAILARLRFTAQAFLQTIVSISTLLIMILCGWKLVAISSDLHYVVDQLLFSNAVNNDVVGGLGNSMAPNTAFCFLMVGVAVLFLHSNTRIYHLLSQFATMITLLLAVFSILGYLFGAVEFYEVKNYIPMAIHTAISFLLLALAIFFAVPTRGLMQQFTSVYGGSFVAWRLLVPAFLLPVIIGLFRLWGQRSGLYNLEFGSALFVTSMILIFLALIWMNTLLLNRREYNQEEVIAEKDYLANLVEQTSDAILSTDTSLLIKSWNKGAEEIYGFRKEEVIGSQLGSLLKSDLDPETSTRLLKHLNEKGFYNTEYVFYDKQHRPIQVQASVTVLKDRFGETTGYVAVHRDITERKQLEQQLREFNQQLEQQVDEKTAELTDVFERISDAFLGVDNHYKIVYSNKRAELLFGLDIQQLSKKEVHTLFADSSGEAAAAIQEAFETREYVYLEAWLEKFEKWFEVNIYPSPSGLSIYFRDITVRKNALQELHASEEKYRLFFENSLDGILLTNGTGEIFAANPSACEIFEMTEAEISKGGRQAILDESDPNWKLFFEERSRTGKAKAELRHFRKSGATFVAEVASVKFYNANGETRTNTIIRDITERKKAEAALQKSEEKYRNLVEQAGDAIAIFSADGRIVDVNESAARLLGYEKDQFKELFIQDILHREELQRDPIQFNLLALGQSTIKQRKMQHQNGGYVETEVRAQRLPDGNFLAIIRDLSDRIQAQQQLQKEKDLSDSIINSLPGIFYFYDHTGKFIRWNKQFETVSEYSGPEIASMHPIDFFEGDDKIYLQARIGEVFTKGVSDAEAHFVTKTGKRIPYYFTGAKIDVNGVPCLLGMGVDITERKRTEAEIQESYEQIRRLTAHLQEIREEERTHIAREIHDELGQQLTVMKMDISWMKKKLAAGDASAVPAKMEELLQLLDGTVASVRRISTELRPSLLDDIGLIATIEWQLESFTKRTGIETILHKPDELQVPEQYVTGLFRIFQESLTNVARHANATQIEIHLENNENEFILYIKDNGDGFDKTLAGKKKTLGLLGMKERTLMMKGQFNISSEPKNGTKVEVRVPLHS
jgi:PAS domain S-box-containing protein